MLHDDILEPFLVKLKDRVESIHVLLGEMETWLSEAQMKMDFIESTFGMKLEAPTADNLNVEEIIDCPGGHSHGGQKCLRCQKYFHNHSPYFPFNCPNSHYGGYLSTMRFRCKQKSRKVHILKKYNDAGKFEKTFQIATESEQTKLKKFLEYMDI